MSASQFRFSSGSRLLHECLLVGVPLLAFVALLFIVIQAQPTGFDQQLARDIQAFGWGSLEFLPRFGSDLGGGIYGMYLLPAAVSAGFAITRRWRLLALVAAAFVLHLVLISPKVFVEAYRPSPAFGVEGDGGLSSFPSGHVQWAASFYGLLAYLLWQYVRTVPARVAIGASYAGIVALTMLGRIELGRHWPIDTVAGVLAGFIAVRLLVMLHDLLHRWTEGRRSSSASAG
jgi:undecaprenyl-diphosphatase